MRGMVLFIDHKVHIEVTDHGVPLRDVVLAIDHEITLRGFVTDHRAP